MELRRLCSFAEKLNGATTVFALGTAVRRCMSSQMSAHGMRHVWYALMLSLHLLLLLMMMLLSTEVT